MRHSQSFTTAIFFLFALSLPGYSGSFNNLREHSEKASRDRVEAWNSRNKEKKEGKPYKEPKQSKKARAKADAEWDEKQKQTSEQIRQEDREYLDSQGVPKPNDPTSGSGEPAVDVVTTEDFPTFLRMVREAVRNKDAEALAPLMTPNFGYNLDPLMEGPGVFEFWEKQDIWVDLELVLGEQFVASEGFMVAPPDFARDNKYSGYRAGMAKTRSGWRFAYFVRGQ